jgi:hypothetical protein
MTPQKVAEKPDFGCRVKVMSQYDAHKLTPRWCACAGTIGRRAGPTGSSPLPRRSTISFAF